MEEALEDDEISEEHSPMTTTSPAPLQVRRDHEIYSKDGGWFRGRWHFSFDDYYDPENMHVGYLRVFNHDTLVPGATWPMHPHRDVEGITYIPAGEFRHGDSLGNNGVLRVGGVQRMTLGSGALHSESNNSETEEVQFIQMWIMPDRRGLEPSVEQRQFGDADRHNRLLQILKPWGAPVDAVSVHQDVSMYVARLDPGVEVAHEFTDGRGGYLYLIGGATDVNGEQLTKGDAAKVLRAGALRVRAEATSELLLVDTPV
jgi:redox-sensitive bicupin YhaK (pirin superfamily)